MVNLIKGMSSSFIGKPLSEFRALSQKNSKNKVPNCNLELGEIPPNFRLEAYEKLKQFCESNYGEYFAPDHHYWEQAPPLVIHTITPTGLDNQFSRILYYLHGGGLMFGTPRTHYDLFSELACGSECQIVALEYRKCPDYTILSCIEDTIAGFLYITSPVSEGGLGLSHNQVVLGGDSSGGGLAARLGHFLKKTDQPKVAGLLMWSPSIDMTRAQPSYDTEKSWDMVPTFLPYDQFVGNGYNLKHGFSRLAYYGCSPDDRRRIEEYGNFFCPSHAVRWPIISPMLSDDLSDMPPQLIIVGGSESLRDESVIYAKRLWHTMKEKQYPYSVPPVTLQIYEEMPHTFMFIPYYPKLSSVLKRCNNFLNNVFNPSQDHALDINFAENADNEINSIDTINSSEEFKAVKVFPDGTLTPFTPNYPETPYEVWKST